MPLNLKKGVDFSSAHERAARRRAKDVANQSFTVQEIDEAATRVLQREHLLEPLYSPVGNALIRSDSQLSFIRNAKLHNGMMAAYAALLEEEIVQSATQHVSVLDDIQKSVAGLDSDLKEEEIASLNGFSQVHYNNFSRAVDQPVGYSEMRYRKDFKTGFPFLVTNMVGTIANAGITLPLRQEQRVPFYDVELVGELTDVGDSDLPIESSPPRHLLSRDKTFRHVIVKREFDGTSRLYKRGAVQCTFDFMLAGMQLVNTLLVRLVSRSDIVVDTVSYWNANHEELALDTLALDVNQGIKLMFQPVRTDRIRIVFKQYTPVERTEVAFGDQSTLKINDLLRGVGFTQLLTERVEVFQGAIYDFSIEEVVAGLRDYDVLGVFESHPRILKHPVGMTLSDTVDPLTITNEEVSYSKTYFLGAGEVLVERYLGLYLQDSTGATLLDELIPLRDEHPNQREILPLHGQVAKLKLFPEISSSLEVYRDQTLLTLGTDYQLSFDDQTTWVNALPATLNVDLVAGTVWVKVLSPNYSGIHWVQYESARTQFLSRNKQVLLKNGRVAISQSLKANSGEVRTVYLLRSHRDTPYVSPVISSYSLKIREQYVG